MSTFAKTILVAGAGAGVADCKLLTTRDRGAVEIHEFPYEHFVRSYCNMFPSLITASLAFFALTAQAIPQQGGNGFGGQGGASSSSSTATASAAATAVSTAAVSTSTVACNNSPDLCNRNYNNITHMGAHDSAFVRDSSTDFTVSGNQYYNATVALSAGLRLLQAQVHNENSTLELCHSSCALLDAGSLSSWLAEIKTWMDNNPNEVVTLILVNSDDQSAATFGAVFESSGISTYGYTPTSTSAMSTWPTLQTLITANTRLVTFIASIDYDTTYPYLLPEFNYVFETDFGVTSLSGFNCTIDRPTSLSSSAAAISAGYMGMLNHFMDDAGSFGISTPNTANLTITNSPDTSTTGALGTHGSQCNSEWSAKPVFIIVNFFNVGPAIEAADNLNGITGTGRTSVSTALLTANSSSSKATRHGLNGGAVAVFALGVVAICNFVLL
ncbi:hypothetical protein PVAG01_04216 [Phlyctema vagabunda]|uniref:PLC-like phosphodiesterase n=1 Tax=Phlyctema vagabunda TaxID=108571 RepID=A0ABR4PNN6_9HELO